MKIFALFLFAAALLAVGCASGLRAEETLSFGRFGTITVYRTSPHPGKVVLFASGDGGWNQGVVDMARELAAMDALVMGFDVTHYLKQLRDSTEGCSYPAGDFEALSQYAQKKLALPRYARPVLVGYSSGATLVYATLAQAPANTFQGAISMGFCPDLPLNKPFCKGSGLETKTGPGGKGYVFQPAPQLGSPWISFQGEIDAVCDPQAGEVFVQQTGRATMVRLPKVGHGFAVQKNWLPQFKEAFQRLYADRQATGIKAPVPVVGSQSPTATANAPPSASEVADLPLVEVEAKGTASEYLAVMVTGDGGWAGLDSTLGDILAKHGIPVVGLDSLQYFWQARQPEEMGRDLERIIYHYTAVWQRKKVILIGYSKGADVLPFMVDRLSGETRAAVRLLALLGPGMAATFEFHLTDWLGGDDHAAQPVRPVLEKLQGLKILCLSGRDETDSLCRQLDPGLAKGVLLTGGHHFGGDYEGIAGIIIKAANE
ncbi:MAG: hypothetical protein A2521_08335 [Deltaproteobacteria bacterium RIFOXYD12_FULL_57_12]|nr:MAG: hypothetical protein A2521_08335 [Deltaproteobacteria bacterium RIFOXYD12_FULL_57_12]